MTSTGCNSNIFRQYKDIYSNSNFLHNLLNYFGKRQIFANFMQCIKTQVFQLSFWIFFQVAVPDVVEAAKDADILIFVIPHQFIRTLCSTLLDNIKPTAVGLSLIKVSFKQLFLSILTYWIKLANFN